MNISEVIVSPDGRHIVTGSWDHTVKVWDRETGTLLATMHNLHKGFLWTTPPTKNAASGWLWTNREDLISVIKCDKQDNSHPEALSDDDPERRRYLAVYNRQDMVMNRLKLPLELIKNTESALEIEIEALKRTQLRGQFPPRQLGQGLRK